ncbi:SR-related CTD-associated factor 11 [Cricetulus griseus]
MKVPGKRQDQKDQRTWQPAIWKNAGSKRGGNSSGRCDQALDRKSTRKGKSEGQGVEEPVTNDKPVKTPSRPDKRPEIQVKRQLREIKDKENERFLKKQLSYHESSKSDKRKGNSIREDLLCERFHYLQVSHRNCSDNKIGEKKNTTVKTNKVQRSNQCRDPCMGNFVLSLFSCGSHSVGPRAYRASCTESVDVNEMSSLIRQKRQEMELSWFSNTLPGSGRVDFVPWSVEAEVIPLITSVLPRTIFPASTMSLDTFGTYHKGYALAHTQGGGEKKQTSGTSNTRGSRRKPATTVPTRRSTRNTRAETVSQPQKSPVSNNSECDAPGNSNSSVSISPPAESEKQTRQAPKRKSVRRGRKQPSLKKKLRKSVPAPEKTTSSDSVEEETLADSDTPPMLEKEQQSGIESSSISSVQTDGENHLVNCLKSCSEQTEENEQTKKHVLDEEVEFLYSEPYTQDPPMLVGEDTGIETKELGVEHEVSTDTSVKGSDPLGNEEQTSGSTESEVQALVCAESPPDDFLPCPASDIEGPQPVSSPLGERSENIGSVINDETIEEDLTVESTDGKDSPVNIEAFEESLKLESCEGEITHTLDRHCVASLVTELPEHVQTVNTEIMPTHDTSDNENSGAIQDCEDNLLKHNLDNTQLDKSSEEKKESLSEHPLPIEFSDTQTEQSEKHFSEDNNETVPMECDSFCSDQNESEMESSVNTDSKQSSENSVTHSSENKLSFDHPAVEKVETVAQPAESLLDKAPKPRTRRSRFHSPSTTWSPNKDTAQEKRRAQSPSPKRETALESKDSQSPSPKRESARGRRKSRSLSPKKDVAREGRPFRSPKREDAKEAKRSESISPRRDAPRENQRSQSRVKDSSSREQSRNERDSYSPRWKERWTNDGWRCPRDKHRNDCPTWVTEKINSGPDPRTRNPEKLKDSHWEENRNENSGNSWSKNFGGSGWISNRGRGGRGKGTYRGNFAYTEQSENRWQSRTPLSGSDSFKSVEQQPSKRKSEQDLSFGTPADRSGWTSASSWAVRKTLPADVQNYYSRRGRNSSGPQSGWMRQEEEAPEQDCNLKDQTNQVDGSQLPVNMMQQHMNVIQPPMNPQHQPMSIFPYPVGVHAPLMNMQRNPFTMHPQLPMHLHTGVPLMQVAAPASVPQGLPPPPPPPPSQQVSYIASQPDGKQVQGLPSACHVSNNMTTQVLPAPAAAPGNTGSVQGPSSGNTSSSSHVQASNAAVKLAESKKLQIQEKAAQEVKLAIKPFYQNKDITKEEYKEIVRKAVDKVCHSKSGEVNSTKVANLVKAYVDKYKYSRKGSQKKALEEPVSTEKNIG